MKRIVWCLTLMMLLVCVGAWALAEEEVYSTGDYEYVLLEDGSAKITYYMGPEETYEVEIPRELDGHTVTAMASGCFELWDLTSVTIPDSVTEIEGNPFFVCEDLQTIEVSPDHPTLALIDGVLFDKTEKKLLCHPAGLEASSYEIPEGITAIGWGAFSCCMKLEHVSIPETVAAIGDYAFNDCDSLRSAAVPDGITAIGEGTFAYCEALEDVSLPDSVESLGMWAFAGCDSLVQISLPDGLTEIGDGAFAFCHALEDVNLPDSVESLGLWAFHGCDSLAQISLPDGVTSIGEEAFRYCESLTEMTIPGSVSSIGEDAFEFCPENLVLTVERDSYAKDYAEENGIEYAYEDANDWLYE